MNLRDKEEIKKLLNIGEMEGIEFCVKCALSKQGWACEDGYEDKYVCPRTYDAQMKIHCPINEYPDRRDLRDKVGQFILESLSEKEKTKIFWKIMNQKDD